jgi:single-strand DNA-binding protein
LNRVAFTGRLTRDPELVTYGETSICKTGVAINERKKQGEEWVDVAHFVDIAYFGRRGELMAEKALKGDSVTVDGKLSYSSWETDDGSKRSKLEVVCNSVEGEFVFRPAGGLPASERPATTGAATPAATDDIPF